MFEIKIADPDVTSGSIPVSWCLDMETIAYLSENKIKEPQVVIVTAPVGNDYSHHKESRKVVPLKDLMAYVEFKSAGPNRVWAFISDGTKASKVRDEFLQKGSHGYMTDILNSDGTQWGWRFPRQGPPDEDGYDTRQPTHGSWLAVDVPKQAFAAEPPKWERQWVNHFFRTKCADQCEYRRRRIFAYSLQPLLLAVMTAVRFLITLVALGIGSRGFSLKPLLHPLRYSMGDTFETLTGGSIFVRSLPEDLNEKPPQSAGGILWWAVRKFCLLPLMPLVLIPVLVAVCLKPVVLSIMAMVALGVVVVGFLIIFFAGGAARQTWEKLWANASDEDEVWYMDQEEITLLTCNPEKKALTFNTLPAKKKTLKLRFLNLKSKVCRPFSA